MWLQEMAYSSYLSSTVLAGFILVDSCLMEIHLHQVSTWSWNVPSSRHLFHYSLPVFFPQCYTSHSHPLMPPVYPEDLIYFPFLGKIMFPSLGPPYLVSLGLGIIAWLSFTLHLISTFEWLYTMFVFLGLGYLTQNDFFSSSIYLPFNFLVTLFLTAE